MTSYNLLQDVRAKLVAQLPFSFRYVDELLFLIYACQKKKVLAMGQTSCCVCFAYQAMIYSSQSS